MRSDLIVLLSALVYTGCVAAPREERNESTLNATPGVTATNALASGREHTHGGKCAVRDTTLGHFVSVVAFGYVGNSNYVNTWDAYDNATSPTSWFAQGIVQDAGPVNTASAAAFVAAAPNPNDSSQCYFAGGRDATSVFAQVWRVTVANHVVSWVKMADMPVGRAHFSFLPCGTTSNSERLVAISGMTSVTPTRTANVDTYAPGANTWAMTASVPEAVFDYGASRVDGATIAISGGNGASSNPTAQFVAFKASSDCSAISVAAIAAPGGSVIDARKENVTLATGRTSANSAIGGTAAVEFASVAGWDGSSLVNTADVVVVEYSGATPAYSSHARNAGTAPTSVRFPTVVDALGATNGGVFMITGTDASGVPVNEVQKWRPSASGGSFSATVPALNGARTGVQAAYIPDATDYVAAAGGQDRYPASGSSTDFLNVDIIR
jgi:hypothetical protein